MKKAHGQSVSSDEAAADQWVETERRVVPVEGVDVEPGTSRPLDHLDRVRIAGQVFARVVGDLVEQRAPDEYVHHLLVG